MEIINNPTHITFLNFETSNAFTINEIQNLENQVCSDINSLYCIFGELQKKRQMLIESNNSSYQNELMVSTSNYNESIYTHHTDFKIDDLSISHCEGSTTNKSTINDNMENEGQTIINSASCTDNTQEARKEVTCSYCNHAFSSNQKLKSHIRIHTQIKKHKCKICQKAFPVPSKLEEHMRSHTGEKPFKCVKCSRPFSKMSSLVRHRKVHSPKLSQTFLMRHN